MYGKGAVGRILSNPFYMGLMKIKGKTFEGKHKPLVSPKTFQNVRDIFAGKTKPSKCKNDFLYRRLIICGCGKVLIGERQQR